MSDENIDRRRVFLKRNAKVVAKEFMHLWKKASVPIKRKDIVEAQIMQLYQEGQRIWQPNKKKRKKNVLEKKRNGLKRKLDALFDISSHFMNPKMSEDCDFLDGQRTSRSFYILN